MIKIVADENIPYVERAFGDLGEVRCVAGREVSADMLADADVLLVRSITQVNAGLLENTSVKFVGTATIGTDHVDQDYLARRGIIFHSAAGSNADSVTEYILTALLVLAQRRGEELAGKSIGIIGVGNIGSRLEQKVKVLGMRSLPNDPPLQERTSDCRFVSLDKALEADFVTCHVPLNKNGAYSTYHLLDENRLGQLREGAVLLNSSRGAVVDNAALKEHLGKHRRDVLLDVWEGEPAIDRELMGMVSLVSPHIAGYSLDGKVNGTVMLFNYLCEFLGRPERLAAHELLPEPPVAELTIDTEGLSDEGILRRAFTAIYDIEKDDADLRGGAGLADEEFGKYFDKLRKGYPVRREAYNTQVRLLPERAGVLGKLGNLGFAV